MSLKFSEWKERGYKVHKGSKAVGYCDNEAMFDLSQVYNPLNYEISEKFENYLVRSQEWEEMPH